MKLKQKFLVSLFYIAFVLPIPSLFAQPYDVEAWGDDPQSTYNIVPNLENTAPNGYDPYFGPPGSRKPGQAVETPSPAQKKRDKPLSKRVWWEVFKPKEAEAPPQQIPQPAYERERPRAFQPSREPLLRLESAIVLPNGEVLPHGFYLVQTTGMKLDDYGGIVSPPQTLKLRYRGEEYLNLPLTLHQDLSATSPIEHMPTLVEPGESDPARVGPYRNAWLQPLSATQAVILYQVGDLLFKTIPIRIQAF